MHVCIFKLDFVKSPRMSLFFNIFHIHNYHQQLYTYHYVTKMILACNLLSSALHIVKDVVVIFCETFSSCDPSIHPWMASYREKTLAEINNPPMCACVIV